ncbi:MAG: ABC transporter ATP-binding protein [Methanomassiliicoccales archaeon]
MAKSPVISVKNLTVSYRTRNGRAVAVNNVSLDINRGEVVGIVGETGCGKSTLAHSISRLLPEPPASIDRGSIIFEGVDMLTVPRNRMPAYRGTGISMIFQEPINSLNPAYRIYNQVAEAIRVRKLREAGVHVSKDVGMFNYSSNSQPEPHPLQDRTIPKGGKGEKMDEEIRREAVEFLNMVRINDPERVLTLYPHELSGGMRQRIMIAMALSEKPKVMIADEPTSALDVTIQAQVLSLMKDLIEEVSTSILFISHDLGVMAEIADRIGVMYAGRIVEIGSAEDIFLHPAHPYTISLMHSFPNIYKSQGFLPTLKGSVPNLARLPPGCVFRERCEMAATKCIEEPEIKDLGEGHLVYCHYCEGG